MRNRIQVLAAAASLALAMTTTASAQCAGDCDSSGDIAVNELVTGVNIALGSAALSTCPSFDSSGDGQVAVNELIGAVNIALVGMCPSGGSEVECILEEGGGSQAAVQTGLFAIPLPVSGMITLTASAPEANGDIPVVIKTPDLVLAPVPVPGLICACVRGTDFPDFGAGNTAKGKLACGAGGLADVDYTATIDHNTNDVDPTCANGEADPMVAGVCNGLLEIVKSGQGPRGSVAMDATASFTLLMDGGLCNEDASDPSKGPDGLPCTEDDPGQSTGNPLPFTSGTATGVVKDVNNSLGRNIDPTVRCGGTLCMTRLTGVPVDCDKINSDPAGAVTGSTLVAAVPSLNLDPVGDIVITANFVCK